MAQNSYIKNVDAKYVGNDVVLEVTVSVYGFRGEVEPYGHDLTLSGNTLKVNCYYHNPFIGSGFVGDNILKDTINCGPLGGIKQLYVHLYTLEFWDTIPDTIHHPPPWIVFLPLDIEENEAGVSLAIFPNPNNGQFVLQGDLQDASRLQIVDVTGRLVYTDDAGIQAGSFKKEIDIGNAPPGLYMLRLYTDKGVLVQKLVVQ